MKFVGYDIQPVEHGPYGTCALDNIPEPGGQAEGTTWCWGLYGRDEAGLAHHIGDYIDFEGAREVYMAITGNSNAPTKPGMRLPASAQVQQAEPVARDVLEAFGSEVKKACCKAWGAADECDEGNAIRDCDIAAIVDRYAAQKGGEA